MKDLPIVCVQGLGFVGSAMATAVASARDSDGEAVFNVIGVDLPNPEGLRRIESISRGLFPFESKDEKLIQAIRAAYAQGNLVATADPEAYGSASVVIVDVNCDLKFSSKKASLDLHGFHQAIGTLGKYMRPGTLVIVETTVPPGTCEKVVVPILRSSCAERGLPSDSFFLAHSYERVMPGNDYFDSIVNFWRVYSGHDVRAADACEAFLTKVVNTKSYPLTRLGSTTASEIAKVLENSYRAITIAFMEEWGRFAEAVGIDLFEVLEAIRMRPTHSNIRQPGFGVGGYCLTKDPLFGELAASEIFERSDLKFPFSTRAISINNEMPLVSLNKIQEMLGGDLKDKRILLLGVSYRQDVGDTRYSPSEIFVKEALKRGARILCHDPLVKQWSETKLDILSKLPPASDFDAVVFAVQHGEYAGVNFKKWFEGDRPAVLDGNNVLTKNQREEIRKLGCAVSSIGRGDGL